MKTTSFDFTTTQESSEHGTVTIRAKGKCCYTPASMYSNNGDPGDDADGEVDFDSIEAWDSDDKDIENFEPDMSDLEEKAFNSI